MIVDIYTKIILKKDKYYLSNFRTGAIDLISENLFKKINIHQKKR